MTNRVLLILTFVSILLTSQKCATEPNNERTVNDNYQPLYTVAELVDKLENSVDTSSNRLSKFFNEWNESITSNTEDFINQNDSIKAVFNVYRTFYKPLNLLELGDWEWGNELNSNARYVAVQNKIFYAVLPGNNLDKYDWKTSRTDSIDNFRPPILIGTDSVLYLTKEYELAISSFLGSEMTELGEGNIMSPSRPIEESQQRFELIRPFVPILAGHWGGYWHIESHPDASLIVFNQELTKARISFRVGYQGGSAILEKQNGQWVITESKETWIE